MAFNFPSNPLVDDVYTSGGVSFTWNGYAWLSGGVQDPASFVLKTGDTMTGPLVLSGAPVEPLQAATRGYVDTAIAAAVSAMRTDGKRR